MRPLRWIALLLLASAGPASACSILLESDRFEPVPIADPGTPLPAVTAQVHAAERSHSFWACDYYAEVDLVLRWVSPSDLRWQDVGVIVAPVNEWMEPAGVPQRPRIVDGVAHLTLWVPDSRPAAAIDQEYEVRVVDRAMRVGPPTRMRVQFPARPSEPYLSYLRSKDDLLVHDGKESMRCSAAAPLGCGPVEVVLLSQGDITVRRTPGDWRMETRPAACVGVRQFSGRMSRMVLYESVLSLSVADAEWADAHDWKKLATACPTLMTSFSERETAAAKAWKERLDEHRRRRDERAKQNGG